MRSWRMLAIVPMVTMVMTGSALAQDDATFDYMVIDCPPSLGVLTINALTMAREVFLPLQPHFLALHGLSKLLRTIELVRERDPRSAGPRIGAASVDLFLLHRAPASARSRVRAQNRR